MARSRNIKPGFFKNELLASLDPHTRLLFAGLWTIADKAGRFEVRLDKIKAEVFPHEQVMLEPCMTHLWDKHFITLYEVDGKHFGEVNNWRRHQHPHHKEAESTIPGCIEEKVFNNQDDIYAWLKNGASTTHTRFKQEVPTRLIPDSLNLIPDSLNLIPDSLNLIPDTGFPSTVGSELPTPEDDDPPAPVDDPEPDLDALADQVIDHLNDVSGKKYGHTEANRKFIRARLKEGATLDQFFAVNLRKTRQWKGTSQDKYLRPKTLWNSENFEGYVNELDGDLPAPSDGTQATYDPNRTNAMLRELYPEDYQDEPATGAQGALPPAGGDTWKH